MKQYLVFAQYEGDHKALENYIQELMNKDPSHFHVVIPKVPLKSSRWVWSEQEAAERARQYRHQASSALTALGADHTVEIGDFDSADAISDTLRAQKFDELIIATPADVLDEEVLEFARRVWRLQNLPIVHVTDREGRRI
jgi:hypothetical protein